MTNEEAIKQLEITKQCDVDTVAQIKALDVAINALSNRPTGEPLTLDQLREMDGQPAWIVPVGKEDWEPHWDVMKYKRFCANSKTQRGKLYFLYEDSYGTRWLAYAYPPDHIGQEAWEPCGELCRNNCMTCDHNADELFGDADYCKDCHGCSKWESSVHNFCERCGRPKTPKAWDMLEKRLRG